MLFVFVNGEIISWKFGLYYKFVYICKETIKYLRSAFWLQITVYQYFNQIYGTEFSNDS